MAGLMSTCITSSMPFLWRLSFEIRPRNSTVFYYQVNEGKGGGWASSIDFA